jgi:hypothetical protein
MVNGGVVQVAGDVVVEVVDRLVGPAIQKTLRVVLRENSPSYAWMPIDIPANADYLTIDFRFDGMGTNDLLTLGLADNLLFALDGGSAIAGEIHSTGLLDVSMFRGATVELFMGLVSDEISGGQITLDNFQFITFSPVPVPEPSSATLLLPLALLLLRIRRQAERR